MKRFLCAGLIACAGQASALSCAMGNIESGYHSAVSLGSDFTAVVGTLEWTQPRDTNNGGGIVMTHEGQEHDIPARFVGTTVGENGARMPIDTNIRVIANCINGDCGYASSGWEMLTFLHNTPSGTVMYSYPCQPYPMGSAPENIERIQACVDGGPCTSEMQH